MKFKAGMRVYRRVAALPKGCLHTATGGEPLINPLERTQSGIVDGVRPSDGRLAVVWESGRMEICKPESLSAADPGP